MSKFSLTMSIICIVFSAISFVLAVIDANISATFGWFVAILWIIESLLLKIHKED